ncbi:MAG: branched-chain amino acid ABC transporter permease [Acidimicrobiales bacterium]
MSLHTFLTLLGFGLTTGAAYGLFALGYSLVYGVLGTMNLAHGDVLMFASFVALGASEAGAPPALAVLAGMATGAVAGAIVDQVAYRPLRHTGDSLAPLVAALGAALILRNLAASAFGVDDRGFPELLGGTHVHLGAAGIPTAALISVPACLLVALGARRFLDRTRYGAMVQAVSQDLTAARLVGIPVWAAVLAVYALSGVVAALGGILYASTFSSLTLSLGWTATVVAFTAAVLGGTTSLPGAVVGGLVLGVANSYLAYLLPSGYRDAIVFFVLAAVLVVRPPASLAPRRRARSRAPLAWGRRALVRSSSTSSSTIQAPMDSRRLEADDDEENR